MRIVHMSMLGPPMKYYTETRELAAWLDTIAYCEGTDRVIEDAPKYGYILYTLRNRNTPERIADDRTGYDLTFGFGTLPTLDQYTVIHHKFGNTTTTAAGRYQFIDSSWNAVQNHLVSRGLARLPDFQPPSQDEGAIILADLQQDAISAMNGGLSTFNLALDKLSWIWASIPTSASTSRYGQPILTPSKVRDVFTKSLSKYKDLPTGRK